MLESLYENIGEKIKRWATWIFVIEAAIATITGLYHLTEEEVLLGLLLMVLGPVAAWVGSWFLFAFGELVEKTCKNGENTRELVSLLTRTNVKLATEQAAKPQPVKSEPIAKPQSAPQPKPVPRREPLPEKLSYALMFQTNDGMVNYLKTIDDSQVAQILTLPKNQIRSAVTDLLATLS